MGVGLSQESLTIVIPAYNEAQRIRPTLERIHAYGATLPFDWDVIVVSDGSSDATPELVEAFAKEHPRFRLLAYTPNRGKGYAVRQGMLAAQGDLVLFSDADLAAPIEEFDKLLAAVRNGAAVAIGSRPLKESRLEIRQPFYREWLGRAFNKVVQMLAIRGIDDTQCGFKLFTCEAAHAIFRRCKLDGFSFDLESLLLARDLGYRIAEVPIRWAHQEGSKVVLLRDGPRMIRDLLSLRLQSKKSRMTPHAD